MHSVAREAGVAAGTVYVHYESKEELVFATYQEIKSELGRVALEAFDFEASVDVQFRHILWASHRYLAEDPSRAKFLSQLEESPFHGPAKARLAESGDPLTQLSVRLEDGVNWVDLPTDVLHTMSFGVVVRLVAAGVELSDQQVDVLIDAIWRGVTR